MKEYLLIITTLFIIPYAAISQNSTNFYAYHTQGGLPVFGPFADIVVNLPNGEFVFSNTQAYRPFWLNNTNLIAYLGPANPDVNVEYSYARLISQSDQEIVVHWRYPTTTNKVEMGFNTYVHELYTIRPNGSVTRIVKLGTNRIEDWKHPGNQFTQELQLTNAGITINSTSTPTSLPRPLAAISGNPLKGPTISTPSHHWKFDEAINAYDDMSTIESITNTASSINGFQANYKAGISGTALSYDGYFSNVQLPKANATSSITGDIALEAWVAVDVNPHNTVPLVHQSAFGLHPQIGAGDDEKPTPFQGGQGYYLGINFEGQPSLIVSVNNVLYYCNAPSGTIQNDQWAHVVGVKSQDQLILYVNGTMVRTEDVPNANITLADSNVVIGRNNVLMLAADASPLGSPLTPEVNYFGLEGAIDEVRIYNAALTPTQVMASYNNYNPGSTITNNPPTENRVLPGDTLNSSTFTAQYTSLKYHELWDNLWQTTAFPDISVKFENSANNLVFWRGMNYGFALVSENNIWNASQSVENEIITPVTFTYEHMMDKECRTSHVRIIENTPARKLIHWRYAPRAPDYSVYPAIGSTYWVDEYYYVYPDQTVLRQVQWHGSPPLPFHDNNLILSPNKDVADLVEPIGAIHFANNNGNKSTVNYPTGGGPGVSEATIKLINTKSTSKPYNLYPANAFHHAITGFAGPFAHWPVAQVNSIGVGATTPDTKPRARSVSFGGNDGMGEGGAPYVCFWGLTDQPIDSLVKLRKSWNSAPAATNVTGGSNEGYNLLSRSYRFIKSSNALSFNLTASTNSPLRNVCIEVSNWDSLNHAILMVNGSPITNFKQGLVRDTLGVTKLVIFYEVKSNSGITSFSITSKPTVITWTGATNTDWHIATNWNAGCVPIASSTVIINDVTNDPIIANGMTGSADNISIGAGGHLTIQNGGILNITAKNVTVLPMGIFTADNGAVVTVSN